MKGTSRRPSPALIVAICALVAALTGTAIGLPGKGRIDRNDLRKNVVGAKNIRKNAVNNKHTALLKVAAFRKATAAGSQAGAPVLSLYRRGPLQVYAKCFLDAGTLRAEIYARSFVAGAVLESDEDDADGDDAEPAGGYMNPGEDEEFHEVSNDANAAVNSAANSDDDQLMAAVGNTAIQGIVGAFAKQGDTGVGNGVYGPGDRCLFHGFFAGIG